MADFPGDDIAKSVAENIGVMPFVNKAGEMGSGFMDFISKLMPGDAPAPKEKAKGGGGSPPAADKGGGGFLNFLSSLYQPTIDAFDQDVDAVKQGRLPPQAMKTGSQALSMMGNPAVNPVMPAMVKQSGMFGPVNEQGIPAFRMITNREVAPGGDWLTLMMRQGGFGNFLEQLLKGVEKVPR